MRISALHNIREPSFIPNGFQREEAPAAAPDHAWQPDMRNKTEAMTDTRHAVEYLNPSVHLEVNASNRTSAAVRSSIEMGRERKRIRTRDEAKRDAEFERSVARYEQLLKLLWEKAQTAGLHEKGEPAGSHVLEPGEAETARVEESAGDVPVAMSRDNSFSDYYLQRGAEAYRRMQEQEKTQASSLVFEI